MSQGQIQIEPVEYDSDSECEELSQQISSYTISELKQLEEITLQTKNHWKKMLEDNLPEETKTTVESCIRQAEEDLIIIEAQIKVKLMQDSIS